MTQKRKSEIKSVVKINDTMKKGLLLSFLLIVFLLILLMVRIGIICRDNGKLYEKIVLAQQGYDSETIPYRRGDIMDSKGTVLATSTDVYALVLDCKVMLSNDGEHKEDTLKALFECYPELDKNDIEKIVEEKSESAYNVLLKNLSYDEMLKFKALSDENRNIKGVWFEKSYIRSYPYGSLAAAVIGFTTSDDQGMLGLENYYNETLSGINGRKYSFLNSDSEYERAVKDAEDGCSIVTTLDANLQSIVEKKVEGYNNTFSNNYRRGDGAEHVGVLIMNPNNGEVLAMASYPTFDLSDPRNLSKYYTQAECDYLKEKELEYDALNRLWTNFCVSYTYEPGSTAKPFTVAMGLDCGALKGDETYLCNGYEEISDYRIRCVNRNGHGMETLEKSLMDSCNDALMQMSYVIGIDNFTKYQNTFGFGLKTNIDLPGETRTDSLVYTKENMQRIDLATNSFGQNFNTTMIQLGTGFCSIINGGNYYKPHIVSKVLDSNGNVVFKQEPVLLKQTISESTSEKLKGYLYNVTASGTGRYAKVNGYSMGGKTGTAQISTARGKATDDYLVSFIGYLPQENPEIMIYCVVEKPNSYDQPHSQYAQNIVREILEEALPYLNIFPDEEFKEGALTPEETDYLTGLNMTVSHPVVTDELGYTTEVVPEPEEGELPEAETDEAGGEIEVIREDIINSLLEEQ